MISPQDLSENDFDRIQELLPGQPQDPSIMVSKQGNPFFLNVTSCSSPREA